MKRIILSILSVVIFHLGLAAQTSVQLEINHKLGITQFAFDNSSTNNIGHQFMVKRLEYYISKISIIHDGGQETTVDDIYILVNADTKTAVDLGSHDVTSVEKVKFHIGVDPSKNGGDPATFPTDHALAPKDPSMHWGWAAGYRFIAIEGMGGISQDQPFELHGLGDANYFANEVGVSATAANGKLTIALDADYNRVLEDISLNAGVIVHGDTDEAKLALENLRDHVFSEAGSITGLEEGAALAFELYPNPSSGTVRIELSSPHSSAYQLQVTDMLGKVVQSISISPIDTMTSLEIEHSGIYMISLLEDGKALTTRKLIVQ